MPIGTGTPDLVRHCVRAVAKEYGGDVDKAFAICVAKLQDAGYLEPGTMELTAAGKAKEAEHEAEPDAGKKLAGYEKLLKAAKKERAAAKESVSDAMERLLGEAEGGSDLDADLAGLEPKHREHVQSVLKSIEGGVHSKADVKKALAKAKKKGSETDQKLIGLMLKHGKFSKADEKPIPAKGAITVGDALRLLKQRLDKEARKSSNPFAQDHYDRAHAEIAAKMKGKEDSTDEKDLDALEGHIRRGFTPNFAPADVVLKRMGRPEHSQSKIDTLVGKKLTKQTLTPDQYWQLHGECPDGWHFDSTVHRCVKNTAESVDTFARLVSPTRTTGLEEMPRVVVRRFETAGDNGPMAAMRRLAGIDSRYQDRALDEHRKK